MTKGLKWLEHDFLQYLESWKVYAMGKEGLSMDKKSKLMLSSQTIEGLKMAGIYCAIMYSVYRFTVFV
jgi:hypothetical protein